MNLNNINPIDGNQYLVNSTTGTTATGVSSFDEVFNNETRSASGTKTLEDIFQSVSSEYGVPVKLLKAVAQAESSFDTNAVSSCGASGIMQLMPETAAGLGVTDVFDAEQNITGGAKMLAYLLDDYDGNTTLALAAYNAGSGAVQKYGGVPPYEETRNYIEKINGILGEGNEADTSDISIAKNTTSVSKQPSADSLRQSAVPISVTDKKDTVNTLFSYEAYLKFLDLYQDFMSKIFESQNDEDKNSALSGTKTQQQNLFELEQSKYNLRARNLLNNN